MISKGAVRVQKKNLWQDALYWVLLLALLKKPRPEYAAEKAEADAKKAAAKAAKASR